MWGFTSTSTERSACRRCGGDLEADTEKGVTILLVKPARDRPDFG
jgi:hypothetical protein